MPADFLANQVDVEISPDGRNDVSRVEGCQGLYIIVSSQPQFVADRAFHFGRVYVPKMVGGENLILADLPGS